MIPESRIGIYNYVYGLLNGYVSDNVYSMSEPQELTESDAQDGFIVIRVGDIVDESEFHGQAFGAVRVFVEAYVPPMSRGRLDKAKYKTLEDDILKAINDEREYGTNEHYSIDDDGIISMDESIDTNANNAYHIFIKSFIVNIQ